MVSSTILFRLVLSHTCCTKEEKLRTFLRRRLKPKVSTFEVEPSKLWFLGSQPSTSTYPRWPFSEPNRKQKKVFNVTLHNVFYHWVTLTLTTTLCNPNPNWSSNLTMTATVRTTTSFVYYVICLEAWFLISRLERRQIEIRDFIWSNWLVTSAS
jgi:hypothetical protein